MTEIAFYRSFSVSPAEARKKIEDFFDFIMKTQKKNYFWDNYIVTSLRTILDNFDEFENSTSRSFELRKGLLKVHLSPQYMNNFDEGLYLEAQKQILRCYHVGMKN